jgi:hypothetical protein
MVVPVRRAAWVEVGEGVPRGAEAASGEVGGRGCCLVECLEGLLQEGSQTRIRNKSDIEQHRTRDTIHILDKGD